MPQIDLDRVMEAVESDDCIGFCKACGEEVSGIEPDGRNIQCECCGAMQVFGAEELLIELA